MRRVRRAAVVAVEVIREPSMVYFRRSLAQEVPMGRVGAAGLGDVL